MVWGWFRYLHWIMMEAGRDNWVLFHCFWHFQSDGSYTDKWILQCCQPLIEYNLNVNWNDDCFKPILAMELKTLGKTVSLSNRKKRKSKEEQGGKSKHHKKMAMHKEHIIDIALNGENYCSSINKWQCYFVAGASIRTHGARMFTPQMIAGLTWKEGTYHFFEIKETALSLMVPNVGLKWKRKKDAVNTIKVSTTSGLVTFTTEIFSIPLMNHSQYALKHCLVDVKEDKRACYTTKEAAVFACHVYQRHLGISYQMQQDKEWGTNMGWSHSPTSLTEGSPKELLLSVYTQIQEGSSGKASDWPILCRHCIIPWRPLNYEHIQGWQTRLWRI